MPRISYTAACGPKYHGSGRVCVCVCVCVWPFTLHPTTCCSAEGVLLSVGLRGKTQASHDRLTGRVERLERPGKRGPDTR